VRTSENEIRDIFERFGNLEKIHMVYDAKSKGFRGYCFIYYTKVRDATAALNETNGMEVKERRIRVDYSKTKRTHPRPASIEEIAVNAIAHSNVNARHPAVTLPNREYKTGSVVKSIHGIDRGRDVTRDRHSVNSIVIGICETDLTFVDVRWIEEWHVGHRQDASSVDAIEAKLDS
jgi:RNA recognition motif-containing protein